MARQLTHCRLPVLVLALLANLISGHAAVWTTDVDWEGLTVARGRGGCTFPKRAAYAPPPTCPPPRTPVSRATASQMGWRFAPILYQHPSDPSFLTDPGRWFNSVGV